MEKKMTKSEKARAIQEFHMRLKAEAEKGSTGATGKFADFHGRDFLLKNGVQRASDVRCREAGKHDWVIRINGKYHWGEIKTAAGGWKVAQPGIRAEDIYPDASYILYAAEVDNLTEENVPDMMVMFTREQFIEMLTVTGRKGLESSLKYNAKRGTVEIQAWSVFNKKTQKWVSARLNRYYDYIEEHNIPTLRDWVKEVRG